MSLDRRLMLNEQDKFLRELESCRSPSELQARIAGMAGALQMTLSLPSTRGALPKCRTQALDCIMRAVSAEARGDEGSREHVEQKLRVGAQMLGIKL